MNLAGESNLHLKKLRRSAARRGLSLARLGLALVLLLTLNFQAAYSQADEPQTPEALPTWTVKSVDATPSFSNMTPRALSFRPLDGVPCAAYGGNGLYYSCYNAVTSGWDTQLVDDSVGVGEYASLAQSYIPSVGTLIAISYYDATNGRLKLAYKFLGGLWTVETVPTPFPILRPEGPQKDDGPTMEDYLLKTERPWLDLLKEADPELLAYTGVGRHSSIANDQYGGFHISYFDDYDGSLNYAYFNGSDWYFELVHNWPTEPGRVGFYSSIQVDGFNDVHIAYFDEKYDDLRYAYREDFTVIDNDWEGILTGEEVDSAGNVGSMCALALSYDDENGGIYTPVISYLDFTDELHGKLKYAKLIDRKDNTWTKVTLDSDGNTGWWSSIVMVEDKAHISYYVPSSGDLKYVTGKPGNWSHSTAVSGLGNVGMFSSIGINPATGYPAILYYNAYASTMEYVTKDRNKWNVPSVVNYNGRNVGIGSSLDVNDAGVPFMSYLDTSFGRLKYARAYGDSFGRSYPISYIRGGLYSSIKLYTIDKPSIAFYDTERGDLWFGYWNGSYWSFYWVQTYNDVGRYVSLEYGSNGLGAVSYYDATNKDLMYGVWDLAVSDWITRPLDSSGDVGMYTSLAINKSVFPNKRIVSYYDNSDPDHGNLKLAYTSNTGVWTVKPYPVDDGGLFDDNVGWYTSADFDGAGNPHISYYDETNGDLKYAYYLGTWNTSQSGDWEVITVPDPDSATDDLGRFTSLKINKADNTRHICYFNLTRKELRYARYTVATDTWEFQTVDDDGDVGYYCSLDLNGAGEPAISYYDNSRGDLKIALSYALPPWSIFFPLLHLGP